MKPHNIKPVFLRLEPYIGRVFSRPHRRNSDPKHVKDDKNVYPEHEDVNGIRMLESLGYFQRDVKRA
jgi:hypothetical protein